MALRIQDPLDAQTKFLLEAILEACEEAEYGAGAFAFVSARGVKLLLEDATFVSFAKTHKFDLIIGVDAVTNSSALAALEQVSKGCPHLSVKAFLHKTGTLFHPKTIWFRTKNGVTLISGSGNLTTGGLRGNWEFFSITHLTKKDGDALEEQWKNWTGQYSKFLKPLDDKEVIERAAKNKVTWKKSEKAPDVALTQEIVIDGEVEPDALPIITGPNDQVLIAEIPNAGTRWNQANFDLETFTKFFGAQLGTQQRVLFFHVGIKGELGDEESRPSVAVKSQNYRFELAAASGLPYPKGDDRPIGVFVRIATRTFKYRLLMPQDADYKTVKKYLKAEYDGRANRMRRIVRDVTTLKKVWPSSPLWLTN